MAHILINYVVNFHYYGEVHTRYSSLSFLLRPHFFQLQIIFYKNLKRKLVIKEQHKIHPTSCFLHMYYEKYVKECKQPCFNTWL